AAVIRSWIPPAQAAKTVPPTAARRPAAAEQFSRLCPGARPPGEGAHSGWNGHRQRDWDTADGFALRSPAVRARGRQPERGVDQRDVAECLREVPDLALVHRVPFLGKQAEVVTKGEQPLEEPAGFVNPADHREVVGHPERAGKEGALVAGQTVDTLLLTFGGVPEDESVRRGQLTLDRLDGANDPLVVGRQEAYLRNQQQ